MIASYFKDLYRGVVEGWDRFWFSAIDPATLGVIRILSGAMLFYTHLVWSLDLWGFMGDTGRFRPELVARFHDHSPFAWSFLTWIDHSPALLWAVHVLGLVVILLHTCGLWSRWTSIAAFIIAVSYVHRAPGALFGLDQINVMLAMYLMLGGAGGAYSLDRWLAERRRHPKSPPLPKTSVAANISLRLIQLHMCVIYLFAGTGKLLGDTWWEGTAMWGAVANSEYQSLDMTWLAPYPLLISLLTQISLAWEISYCALVWPRLTRPLVIALAIPLHLGIAIAMGMITFGLVMLIANMAFISPWIVRELEHQIAKRWDQSRAEPELTPSPKGGISRQARPSGIR